MTIDFNEKIIELIKKREIRLLRDTLLDLSSPDIAELISNLPSDLSIIVFRILPREVATEIFEFLPKDTQRELLNSLGTRRIAILLNEMAADDRTALFEEVPSAAVKQLLLLLSKEERNVALSLLGYPDSSVGRLMTPDYIAIKGDWDVDTVLSYIRENGHDSDSLNVLYILDQQGKLIDEIKIRNILLAKPDTKISEISEGHSTSLMVTDDQESAVILFKKYSRTVLPVVDTLSSMLGIITVDDVLSVAQEEATEDIQKFGGSEALEDPYLRAPFLSLIRSRASWLVVLFIGEMLTASAMSYFEDEIQKAVVLALFVPLIISSGGNSGSQAATLIIRSLAIGEITLSDWFLILRREVFSGFLLGTLLGSIGFLRILIWSIFFPTYGAHWMAIGLTIWITLICVVLTGTLVGAMFPLILKKLGADPATSSAPFVATVVDVFGLVIYFSFASIILKGLLL